MLRLTHWEYEELVSHLKDRDDIWSYTPKGWFRAAADGELAAVLQVVPPQHSGPYRLFTCAMQPVSWSLEQTEDYFQRLCLGWTAFGLRQQIAQFLVTELQVPTDKAYVAAIVISGYTNNDTAFSAVPPIAEQLNLFPPDVVPDAPIRTYDRIRTYGFSAGGYLALRFVNGRIRAALSLPTDKRYGGGYANLPLCGTLRSRDGRDALAAAFLAGWPLTDENPQQELPYADQPEPAGNLR